MTLVSFTIPTGILSSPGDVDDFSLLIILTIYSGVTSLNLWEGDGDVGRKEDGGKGWGMRDVERGRGMGIGKGVFGNRAGV